MNERPRLAADLLTVLTTLGATPLVGREVERAILRARLGAASASPGVFVTLSGEPGIGKTRLALEVCGELMGNEVMVIAVHCYEQLHTLPYAPFHGTADLPELASLLDQSEGVTDARVLASAQIHLFDQIDRLLLDRAGDNTLVLLVDDLHWADAASLDLLLHLARRGRRGHRAILATVRVDARAPETAVGQLLLDLTREGLLLD